MIRAIQLTYLLSWIISVNTCVQLDHKGFNIFKERYKVIYLDDIPTEKFQRGISDGQNWRKLYFDENQALVYKVWNQKYESAGNFINALKEGFFNDIALIESVIFDKQRYCRGYVCPKGQMSKPFVLTESLPIAGGCVRFLSWKKQDERYKKFYKQLINNTVATQYAFVDYTPFNLILFNGEYYLIDLENALSLADAQKKLLESPYVPQDYRKFILTLSI